MSYTFTPGPWQVVDDTEILAGGSVIADTMLLRGEPTPEQRANADLISAAPDLFAAAHTALRDYELRNQASCPIARALRAAISKAMGGQR